VLLLPHKGTAAIDSVNTFSNSANMKATLIAIRWIVVYGLLSTYKIFLIVFRWRGAASEVAMVPALVWRGTCYDVMILLLHVNMMWISSWHKDEWMRSALT
jgi:expansin (peptidoglycan-binding protein)